MIEQGLTLLLESDPAVKALSPVGGFFVRLPTDQSLPSWSYRVLSDTTVYTLQGREGLMRYRIQMTSYGSTGDDCIKLAKAIDVVLSGYRGTLTDSDNTVVQGIFRDTTADFYDTTTGVSRRSVDYLVWFYQQ